jgi:hypothetical protein
MPALVCEWNLCSQQFNSETEFIPHISSHFAANHLKTQEDGFQCKWVHCLDSYYKTIDLLLSHVLNDHLHLSISLPNACLWKDCNQRFPSSEDLTYHINEDHVQEKQSEYACFWMNCERELRPFQSRQKMMRHLQTRKI